MIPGFGLRVSWIFMLFGIGTCYPNYRHDYETSVDASNVDFQSLPSYVPKGFGLTYESNLDYSDPEDDSHWIWPYSAYVNPEKTSGFPAKSQQESTTGSSGSEEFGAWYDPSGQSDYAGGAGDEGSSAFAGGTETDVYADGLGPDGTGSGAYAGGEGPGVYTGGVSGAGSFDAGGVETGVYAGSGGSGGAGSGARASRASGMESDYGYSPQSAGTIQQLSSLGDGLMTAHQLPFEAWNTRLVPDQVLAQPPVHPSSLVVQSHGAFERARDFRSDITYSQNTFDYIPLTEMQKETRPKTGPKGQNLR
ncbi:pupal cuticle protein 36-like [Melanotaenia boesemani]|uniref:pupal cuticle protein 36-like n=1 Tax=Melanotaenia boesemani TaxID=1250792 RepID=UPI001C055724|nr:pupal cuticle protein 36-like [Melanotaenia boesemani]